MLILTRTPSQKIIMGDQGEVELTVLAVRGKQVKIGIKAHETISVHREEIFQQIKQSEPTDKKTA